MKVLIGCERSGIVRNAFIKAGHNAISCDILPTTSPGPHYQGNVFDIIDNGYDLAIFHPPCTYLTYAGNRYWNRPGRAILREAAYDFVMKIYNCKIPRIAIENPVGLLNTRFRKPNQIVRPYDFGDSHQKNICLWTRNLPPLFLGKLTSPQIIYTRKTGPKAGKNIYFAEALHGSARSVFFPGIASAMASQWSY